MNFARKAQEQASAAVSWSLTKRLKASELPAGIEPKVIIGLSGGADSLALAAITQQVGKKQGIRTVAVIIDHGLQENSSQVAEQAQVQALKAQLDEVEIQRVEVIAGPGGLEQAARRARLAKLEQRAKELGAIAVLLGATLNDQAEQVLLGLARGAGARSLAGIPRQRGFFSRPFLGYPSHELSGLWREQTEAICQRLELTYWQDPMNFQSEYLRVAARQSALPALQEALGAHTAKNLVRTAELLADDADYLEQEALRIFEELRRNSDQAKAQIALPVRQLKPLHRAIRSRIIRLAIKQMQLQSGSNSNKTVLRRQILHIDALIIAYHGQGEVFLPGKIKAVRKKSTLLFMPGEPKRGSQSA